MDKKELHAYLDKALEYEYTRGDIDGYQQGRTDIGAAVRPLYCRILATGHSIRIGAGHSSSLKYVKNLKRL